MAPKQQRKSLESSLREKLNEDTREFVVNSIQCIMAKTDHEIPCPMVYSFHSTILKDVVQFDFPYTCPSHEDNRRILLIKDDLSCYDWLRTAKATELKQR